MDGPSASEVTMEICGLNNFYQTKSARRTKQEPSFFLLIYRIYKLSNCLQIIQIFIYDKCI